MLILTVLIVVATTIALVLVPASRGARRTSDQLERALQQLLQSPGRMTFLSIRPKYRRDRFLQFGRYKKDGVDGIVLAFPLAPWSEKFFPMVVSHASSLNLDYEVQVKNGAVSRFVYIWFGQSTTKAAQFAKFILVQVFGFEKQYVFRVRMNIS